MRVFVTGVNGYIGAVLAPYLLERGFALVGLDTGYYLEGWLYSDNKRLAATPHTLNKDLRAISASDLEGCDAVVHMAELSNDPLGQNNPEVTHQINYRGSVALAQEAARAGALANSPDDAVTRMQRRVDVVAPGFGLDPRAVVLDQRVHVAVTRLLARAVGVGRRPRFPRRGGGGGHDALLAARC